MVRGQCLLIEGERLESQSRSKKKKISQHASVLFGFDRQKWILGENCNAATLGSSKIYRVFFSLCLFILTCFLIILCLIEHIPRSICSWWAS